MIGWIMGIAVKGVIKATFKAMGTTVRELGKFVRYNTKDIAKIITSPIKLVREIIKHTIKNIRGK